MSQPDAGEKKLWSGGDDAAPVDAPVPWLVMVVDDDAEVHAVTRLALSAFEFDSRPVRIIDANSAVEARVLLQQHPEVALILLDVVMETEHAGLDLVAYIRDELKNPMVRIVLRTGQPGQAPPLDVVVRYEIDDYRSKTEMTFERLNISAMTALRTYRLLQQMAQRQQELAQSNQDLERFAYVASHDLQAPLRGVAGFTQILQKRYGAKFDGEGRELLDFVVRGAVDMQALINDLLQLSRVGRSHTTLAMLDLNKVVAKACVTLKPQIDERGARIEYAGLPVIEGDLMQFDQLLRNLIENAIKFQPGPNPAVTITAQAEGGEWIIRVADHGIGIEQKYLEVIFEIFRRLHTPDQFRGTGIGLAICKKVVQLHGGSIHAESVPGAGTTMVVRLPARQKKS